MRNNIMNDAKVEKGKNFVSKFDFSAGNSNTASIGRVDIGYSQMLVPGSKLLIKQEQLVRMAPLVAPTYAKQFFKTWGMQIPIEDIWPNFSAMMTSESIARNGSLVLPKNVPMINSNQLLALCLEGAHASVFRMYNPAGLVVSPADSNTQWEIRPYEADSTDEDWGEFCAAIVNQYFTTSPTGLQFSLGSVLGLNSNLVTRLTVHLNNQGPASLFKVEKDYDTPMNFFNDDLVLKPDFCMFVKFDNPTVHYPDWIKINFRLSSFGRQLFKLIRGLGYPTDFGNSSHRSLLPLFATYKAYWDIFGLNQFQNWEETYCSRLITLLSNYSNQAYLDLSIFNIPNDIWTLFRNFVFNELGNMWVTEKDDFVSAHLPQSVISPKLTGVYGKGNLEAYEGEFSDNMVKQVDTSSSDSTPVGEMDSSGHAFINYVNHSHLDSEALKRLYKMTNRNTMLGREIAKLMEARGLGLYMQRTRTNMIGETSMTLDISPVFSTSDTYNEATDEGANIGDYSGRGVGYSKSDKPMFCKTESFCYVIILTAVTADSGYSQGEDITTSAVDADGFYQPEFEDLGQEIHEKSVVVASSDGVIVDRNGSNQPYIVTKGLSKSFGFASRYSGWKVGRSCSNGGFALASERDNFIPYIGDKLIFPEERFDLWNKTLSELSESLDAHADIYDSWRLLSADNLPTAGNAWRFLMRYPWMQNLLRIFRNTGRKYVGSILSSSSSLELFERIYLLPENYMIFNDLWVKAWCPMLPIAETYGTIDHDKKELEFVDRA